MALFTGGLLLGFLIPSPTSIPVDVMFPHNNKYKYVNPLLTCGDIPAAPTGKIKRAESETQDYITLRKNQGTVQDISVYYRDLNEGGGFSIDGDNTFSPGSLLKLPMMMTVYMKVENDPDFLSRDVEFASSSQIVPFTQEIPAKDPIVLGKRYSMDQLVQHMILDSDNNATNLVYETMGLSTVNDTFRDFGLQEPSPGADYYISVKDYSNFFRALYNATFLSPDLSEKALKLLSMVQFKDGLVAGVPAGVAVAHKFGEREVGIVDQLHDCGIIYANNHPYILCVMTRGTDVDTLSKVVADISKIVYNDTNK